ncbi:hypothetical protein DYB25_007319 [Aphanomyces astaci]|uniref:Cytochrome b5 heme-binding domain-containing protein n=1 Tax=Aphanomyces astaci TaxID=112090 RepID=A0A397CXB9_APHAT|nr:hypothetical protein DYB25_007319 [Aphanomyces astaci]RHY22098.1 hypothetical protein DYB36_012820 [Aphanomyces astaci]RHY50711.1 hypothetical protein DYB38_009315 [Aphanomyces astaci]RHY51091.1 hypothetical protein DYB30_010589 [Aphanomyces astaci]RHZ23312.1 hypothetical protein DYB31_005577 [Aphanomyces astaci]
MCLKPGSKKLTWAAVREHNKADDAWIVIHHKVYDISHFDTHPGGAVMFTQAGEDATDAFAVFHPSSALKLLEQYYIGDVDESTQIVDPTLTEEAKKTQNEFVAAYRKLRLDVKRLGLYNASKGYYLWKTLSTLSIGLLSAFICFNTTSTAVIMVAAVILGLFYQQCGWLAHDYGHQQVFDNHTLNDLCIVMVGNLWQGFSCQWWKNKHNTHHAIPNLHTDPVDGYHGDPDIDTMPVLAWSLKMAKEVEKGSWGPFFIKHQAALYFPILLFARVSWVFQSYLYAFRSIGPGGTFDPLQYPVLERAGLVLYYTWNVALVYFSGMSFVQAISFLWVSQASCGLFLALVFSIGHNGMAVYDRADKPDFWKLQVLTTRNISPTFLVDWFCGGLNYQVDHHLFPTVPRHNLAQLNVLVKSLCKQFAVPYHETGFWAGLGEVVDHLKDVSNEFIREFPAM